MHKTGLVIFLLSVLWTLSSGVSREYHLVKLEKTWTEAQRYCRENFADLATIDNEEDLAKVNSMLENPGDLIWIGLYDDVTSWRWSMDNTTAEFSDWIVFWKDSSRERCGLFFQGALHDHMCGSPLKSVCYDERTNRYIPVGTPMSWSSAQSFCRKNYTDLASMRNQQEKEEILKVIHPESHWWIGLFRDSWKWSDQSNSSFRWWSNGEPNNSEGNEFCAAQKKGAAAWIDVSCDDKFWFICSVPMLKVLKVELIAEGSVDLNDPARQEAILEQMEKHMRDQGIHQFRLRWRKQPDGEIFHEKKEEQKP